MIGSEDWGTWRVRLYDCCSLFAQEHASGEILIFLDRYFYNGRGLCMKNGKNRGSMAEKIDFVQKIWEIRMTDRFGRMCL